ncbi:MAG: SidA/IucD/PvdA family monooxygenase [Chlamydiota bacterium]
MIKKEIIGVGFGPSNLATAVSLVENDFHSTLFLEKKERFSWFPGMMLKRSRLQNSCLKDLVLVANPRSRFTFLNYLFEKKILDDFINLNNLYPEREDVNNYMFWVSSQLNKYIQYSSCVSAITPHSTDLDCMQNLKVSYTDMHGKFAELICENIVIGTGAAPFLPTSILPHPRATHTVNAVQFLGNLNKEQHHHFLVIGGSQSSAEILYHILELFPYSQIQVVSKGFIFRSLEASALINRMFSEYGMSWFGCYPRSAQKNIYQDLLTANYSAVDPDLIQMISEILYFDKKRGRSRVTFHHYHELIDIVDHQDTFTCKLRCTLTNTEKNVHGSQLIFATGFSYRNTLKLLEPVEKWLVYDKEGIPIRNSDYSLKTHPNFLPKIFVHSVGDATFGLTEGGMTNLAVRGRRMMQSMQQKRVALRRKDAPVTG